MLYIYKLYLHLLVLSLKKQNKTGVQAKAVETNH